MPLFAAGSKRGRGLFAIPRSLLGAATKTDERNARGMVRLHEPWQERVFANYDRMGECWNPAQFYARALAKARIFAATGDPNDPEELTTGWAYDLVQAWQEIPEPYGRLRSLIGEGRFTQSRAPHSVETLPPVWEFLSPTELVLRDDGRTIERIDGIEKQTYKNISDVDGAGDPAVGEMRMWRFWRPHPMKSGRADSSFKGVLDLYEQLWWLTMSERAELRNRIANQGILLVPEEIDFSEDDAEEQQQEGDDPQMDPFEAKLHEIMTLTLQDPGNAAAASPGVVRGPADMLHPDTFRHIRFHDPSSSLYISDRERSLIHRIAIGLDLPIEEITGLGALNHWNAWKLDDAKFAHVQPEGDALVKDLTDVVLRPIGRASSKPDAEAVFIAIDWSELVTDPDKGKTAIQLRQLGVIGDQATRDANDFDESTEMTVEERAEWLAIQLSDPSLLPGPEPDPAQNENPPADTTPVDPAPEPNQQAVDQRIISAAAAEARAATGRWVLSKRRSCPECFAEVEPATPETIIAALGPKRLPLLDTTAAHLTARMRDRFFDQCRSLGYEVPVEAATDVEMWFAATLYERFPVTDLLVENLLA